MIKSPDLVPLPPGPGDLHRELFEPRACRPTERTMKQPASRASRASVLLLSGLFTGCAGVSGVEPVPSWPANAQPTAVSAVATPTNPPTGNPEVLPVSASTQPTSATPPPRGPLEGM